MLKERLKESPQKKRAKIRVQDKGLRQKTAIFSFKGKPYKTLEVVLQRARVVYDEGNADALEQNYSRDLHLK